MDVGAVTVEVSPVPILGSAQRVNRGLLRFARGMVKGRIDLF